jgi:hypothetical protein
MKLTITLWMVAEAVVKVACPVFGSGAKSFMIGSCDQRRNAVVASRRGWGWRSIVGGV